MKKIIIILLTNMLLFTGCSGNSWLGDCESVTREKGESIVEAIVQNDMSVIKDNFSGNVVKSTDGFEEMLEEFGSLLENQKIKSYGYIYCGDEGDKEGSYYTLDSQARLFIHTETTDYYIYYEVRTQDTSDRENIGITKMVIAETVGNAIPVHGGEEVSSENKGIFVGNSKIENGDIPVNGEIEGVEIITLD